MNNLNREPFDYQARLKQLEQIKKRKLEQRKRDRQQAIAFLTAVALVVIGIIAYAVGKKNETTEIPQNSTSEVSTKKNKVQEENDKESSSSSDKSADNVKHKMEVKDGITYVDGIMIVNKTYSLPENFDPKFDNDAYAAFEKMKLSASNDGINLFIKSGYRSYQEQTYIYNQYVTERGTKATDQVSARPGHSEHQSGLSMDVNSTEFSFADTPEGKWLAEHCTEYGFIIRFPKGKEEITGFDYEPWHIRFVGVETAKDITEKGVCLEEYLGVDSKYKD